MEKTKQKLLQAARELFAQKGIDNTTMSEIAEAAGKSRRTIYTYFCSREEIYLALIATEMEYLNERLQEVVNLRIPADEKFKQYIFVRLDTFREIIQRNGTMRASFFQDANAVERARRPMKIKEIHMLRSIFQEGIDAGLFCITNTAFAADITFNMLKGLEKPYYRDRFFTQMQQHKNAFASIVLKAISI